MARQLYQPTHQLTLPTHLELRRVLEGDAIVAQKASQWHIVLQGPPESRLDNSWRQVLACASNCVPDQALRSMQ